MKPKPLPASSPASRRNVYFRNPTIFNAFQMAIEKKLIRARSASERLEELVTAEVRRLAPKMRKAGIIVPPEAFN